MNHRARASLLLIAALLLLAPVDLLAQPQRVPRLPDSVKLTRDIPYAGTDNPRQRLDLLLPAEPRADKLPVLVFIHGGAWRAGDKRGGLRRIAPFVATGRYAGASIAYRLTGEAQWPTQIHDCKAAIRWLRANASKNDIDADRIAVWGSSAGGHLVAMLGTSGDVAEMDGDLGPHADVSSRVAAVIDYFGPTDMLQMDAHAPPDAPFKHDAPDSPEAQLIGGPIQENKAAAKSANPITYVTPDDPPFLVVHGNKDPLVPHHQSQILVEALDEADVPATLITVDGAGHGRGFPRRLNATIRRFLDHHFYNEGDPPRTQTLDAAPARPRRND